MKNGGFFSDFKSVLVLGFILFSAIIYAQNTAPKGVSKSDFWQKVHFGGGIGLNIGSGYTNVSLAPSGVYNFNPYFSAGVGLQGSYVRVRDSYESYIYGGSLIGLFNPVEQVQVSAELEQLRVNRNLIAIDVKDNFWNTALFLGAGYRAENVTIGVRYNVLYNKNDFVYSDAFMPFIRVYF
jgi:hypothetical protein